MAERWWLMQQPSEDATINSTRAALKQGGASVSRLSQQLAHAMMGLAEKDHRPQWSLVTTFADNLTHELLGKQLTNAQNTALRECLSEAVLQNWSEQRSFGRPPSRNIGNWWSHLIEDFIKLREFVQGPDDLPVRDVPVRH